MNGRRLPDGEHSPFDAQPGDYWREDIPARGWRWFTITPNGHYGNLGGHEIEEHADGTITVSPSIKVSSPGDVELYHGFLERGVWREA